MTKPKTLPSERLIKWCKTYLSLRTLDREDLQHIVWAIQDMEEKLYD